MRHTRAAQAWQLEKAVLASTTAMAEKAYSLLQVFAAFKPHKHKRAVASHTPHTLLRAVCAVQSCVALRMAMPTDRVRVGAALRRSSRRPSPALQPAQKLS